MRSAMKFLTRCSMLQTLFLLLALAASGTAQMMQAISNDVHHSSGPAPTWTVVQVASNLTCTASTGTTFTCTITGLAPITPGNALLLMSSLFMNANGPGTFSSASGDSALTHCPSQSNHQADGSGQLQTDCAVALSATGGGTSVSFTWGNLTASGTFGIDAVAYEVHRSTGLASIDTCGAGTASACTAINASCTTCVGPTPTVTGTDFVAVWNAVDPSCSAVASPYNSSPTPIFDPTNVGGSFAGSLSQTSGIPASWTCAASSPAAMATLALK
jgi:hypothetical protein